MTIAYTADKPFVNVKKPVYAILTDEEAYTYGTVAAISPLMSVKVQTKTDNNSLYGDGTLQETSADMGETTLDIEVNTTSLAFQAAARGHAYDSATNHMTVRETDTVPYMAIGFAMEKKDGTYRAYWFMKGQVGEVDVDSKQREGKTEFSTPTISVTCINGQGGVRFDTKDNLTAEAMETYLTTVPSTFVTLGE